jgi:hypothetical protein
MYWYMDEIPDAGGPHQWGVPANDNALYIGFSEGWAHFWSAAVQNSPYLLNTTTDDSYWIERYLEEPIPDAPYYLETDYVDPLPPPRNVAQYEGAHVKGAIAVALWDLFDALNDGDYYVSSTLWGHNNDFNSGESWNGIGPIWDVMTNFDPHPWSYPYDPVHDHPWTIYEFLHGWRELGYTDNYVFTDIFEAHCVPGFILGDVDNSGGEPDIGDVVFLVDWMFPQGQSGVPPPKPSAADLNADGFILVDDLVWLIEYSFQGGPAPRAGCIDYYDGGGLCGDPLYWHNNWHPSLGGCDFTWSRSSKLADESATPSSR